METRKPIKIKTARKLRAQKPPSSTKRTGKSETSPGHLERFDQLLDDAVLGVNKK
jgi:hypothetical protein